jgi:hypothetical protein
MILFDKTDNGICGYPFPPAAESHSLSCGGFDIYLIGPDLKDAGKPFFHPSDMGRQLRHFSHYRIIKVIYPVTLPLDPFHDFFQHYHAVNIFVSGITIRKMHADIAHCQGAEQGVNDGMDQDIRVGVSRQPKVIGDLQTADNKGAALGQTMGVKSDTYSEQDYYSS